MTRLRPIWQLYDAVRLQLRPTTRELGILLAFVVVLPLGFLIFLGEVATPAARPQVLAGSVMMEMGLLNINVVAQGIAQDKSSRLYDLWVSLPVSPVVYVASLALTFLPFTLLSAVITLGIGSWWFGLPIGAVGLLVGALLLVWASTLGLGFLVAVYGSTPRQINANAQIAGIVMTLFTPVFYPIGALPVPLQYLARGWPLTWGAELLRGVLVGAPTASLLLPAAVLVGFALLWAVLIARGIRWRSG